MLIFPKFWLAPRQNFKLIAVLLSPLALIWYILGRFRLIFGKNELMSIPVICIGNITIGGNGKTPTAIKLQQILFEMGFEAHIISRGYRGKIKGPHFVDKFLDSTHTVGDEALMISNYGPNWVSKNRKSAVIAAVKKGADVVILDDGFQNHSLKKDLSILVIDTLIGFGNGKLIPSGPLREPVSQALNRADIILTLGTEDQQHKFSENLSKVIEKKRIFGMLKPIDSKINWSGKKLIAFSGIGHPQKFFQSLGTLGAKTIKCVSFPNHTHFKKEIINSLIREARAEKAHLVTTEKDFIKLPESIKNHVEVLKVHLQLDRVSALKKFLNNLFGG